MYIGPYQLSNNLIVAPMAGVTDRPFRTLCKYFGAGHAVSEMMTADKTLQMSKKSLYRANFDGELAPISAQIAGSDPEQLAEAARHQVANGAQIVDINMGCPAKKYVINSQVQLYYKMKIWWREFLIRWSLLLMFLLP